MLYFCTLSKEPLIIYTGPNNHPTNPMSHHGGL